MNSVGTFSVFADWLLSLPGSIEGGKFKQGDMSCKLKGILFQKRLMSHRRNVCQRERLATTVSASRSAAADSAPATTTLAAPAKNSVECLISRAS